MSAGRSGGLAQIASLEATPWTTALACERDGWIVEVNPLTGYAVRRASLGKLGALRARVSAVAGQAAVVYLQSPSHVFKFVSHQRFEPRRLEACRSILAIGELFALAFDADAAGTGVWQELTSGLMGRDWEELVRKPDAAAGRLPAPLVPELARDVFDRLHEQGADAPTSKSVVLKAPVAARAVPSPFRPFHVEAGRDGAGARLLARVRATP